jgi:hypothetical protein
MKKHVTKMKKHVNILIMLIILSSISYAQSESLPDPGITPDSPFYFLDKFSDNLALTFTFDKTERAKKALEIAKERLAEIEKMSQKKDLDSAEKAKKLHDELILKAENEIKEIKEKDTEEKLKKELELELELEKHETNTGEIINKIKLELESNNELTQEEKEKLFLLLDELLDKVSETKIKIVTEKEKLKLELKEKGLSDEEIEEEIKKLESKEGLLEIKKEKADAMITSAKEDISEAITQYKIVYDLKEGTETILEDLSQYKEEAKDEEAISEIVRNVEKFLPEKEEAEKVEVEIKKELLSEISQKANIITGAYITSLDMKEMQMSPDNSNHEDSDFEDKDSKEEKEDSDKPTDDKSFEKKEDEFKEGKTEEFKEGEGFKKETEEKPDLESLKSKILMLIKKALTHLSTAEENFKNEEYSAAYGHALAAKKLAKTAQELLDDASEHALEETKKEEFKEIKNRLKIKIEKEEGKTEVEVEKGEAEFKFKLAVTDPNSIIREIAAKTGLSEEEIKSSIIEE